MTANLISALAGSALATASAIPAAAVSHHQLPACDLIAGLAGRAG